jgi:aspartate kinase
LSRRKIKLNSETKIQRVVLKFGGTSLSDGERIKNLARKVVSELQKGKQIAVVVSAMGKTTDILIDHFLKACEKKTASLELDDVVSMGERISARLFAVALKTHGINARYFDPSYPDWPIITDEHFGNAKPILKECIPRIKRTLTPMLERGMVPVIPGFLGRTLKGKVTTLGRGGSDVTAFTLARAIEANEVIIVTDVDGIMTADPKIVSNAKRIEKIEARKLVNLCDSEVKFIRRKALKFLNGSFKVRIVGNYKNEFDSEGTIVTGYLPKVPIRLAYSSPISAITVVVEESSHMPKILSKIFMEISHYKIPILAQSSDIGTVCIYIPEVRVNEIVEGLHSAIIENGHGLAMTLKKNLAFLSVECVESEKTSKILKGIIQLLKERDIGIFGVHTVASNILIFVDWAEKERALILVKNALRDELKC